MGRPHSGERLDDAHLDPSDAMPPPDVSLAEATREFSAEGLIRSFPSASPTRRSSPTAT